MFLTKVLHNAAFSKIKNISSKSFNKFNLLLQVENLPHEIINTYIHLTLMAASNEKK